MANEELMCLKDLCMAFKRAISVSPTDSMYYTPTYIRIQNQLTPEDIEKMEKASMAAVSEAFNIPSSGEPHEAFLKKCIKVIETEADIYSRIIPAKEVAAFIPDELKNKKDAEALKKAGAPKLASLCA